MGSFMQTKLYNLQWKDHPWNQRLAFEYFLQTETFTDVTLACDGEGEFIKCHKIILAASSSYLQRLFMENDCPHPIVILPSIRFSELKALLEYIYKGEVIVSEDQLAGLLKAAKTLQVKGLVEDKQRVVGGTPLQIPHHSPPSASSIPTSNPFPTKMWTYNLPFLPSDLQENEIYLAANSRYTDQIVSNGHIERSQSKPGPEVPLAKRKFPVATEKIDASNLIRRNQPSLGHTSFRTNSEQTLQDINVKHSLMATNATSGPVADKVPESSHSFSQASDNFGIPQCVRRPTYYKYKSYSALVLIAALEDIRVGMSVTKASRKYGIPSRTLYCKMKKLGIITQRIWENSLKTSCKRSYEHPLDLSALGNVNRLSNASEDEIVRAVRPEFLPRFHTLPNSLRKPNSDNLFQMIN